MACSNHKFNVKAECINIPTRISSIPIKNLSNYEKLHLIESYFPVIQLRKRSGTARAVTIKPETNYPAC